jgi:hypothetical protein
MRLQIRGLGFAPVGLVTKDRYIAAEAYAPALNGAGHAFGLPGAEGDNISRIVDDRYQGERWVLDPSWNPPPRRPIDDNAGVDGPDISEVKVVLTELVIALAQVVAEGPVRLE